MGAVDDHSGELGKHAALSLVPQAANPDSGATSGNGVFWVDSNGALHFKTPLGVDAIIQTSVASGAFLPLTVMTQVALPTNTYATATQRLTVTATGIQTVNGVALLKGMRVGVFGEGASKNGIYDVLVAGAVGVSLVLQRSADANASGDFLLGKAVNVSLQDIVNGGKFYEISNTSAITLDTTTITVVPIIASVPQVKWFENLDQPGFNFLAVTGSGAINLSVQRFSLPFGVSATQLDLLAHLTVVASTHFSYTISAGLYSYGSGTNNTAMTLASSTAFPVTINSSVYTNFSGTRYRSCPLATWNVTPGEYMMALMISNNGPAGTTGSFSLYGASSVSIAGVEGAAANYSVYFGPGIFSAATGAMPASLVLSNINQTGTGAVAQPYFRILGAGA